MQVELYDILSLLPESVSNFENLMNTVLQYILPDVLLLFATITTCTLMGYCSPYTSHVRRDTAFKQYRWLIISCGADTQRLPVQPNPENKSNHFGLDARKVTVFKKCCSVEHWCVCVRSRNIAM